MLTGYCKARRTTIENEKKIRKYNSSTQENTVRINQVQQAENK
ncbi:hypothetical protein T4C_10841 [Trichinella pseudospiralis]|uniref:Uncharacterized protein n=1 Tax=Trichinella pseudospiralis TaxID=6337 RepID=A0A0V1GKP2_TRIPS|nr:hypothetical protein T4C_10841 [Trichinella pseudospiralis]